MFRNDDDLHRYIVENYPDVSDHRMDNAHWDLECTQCKIVRGFQVIRRDISGQNMLYHFDEDLNSPVTYIFCCPVCGAFKEWVIFEIDDPKDPEHARYYRISSLPGEGLDDIEELPDDPPALRAAYRQAIRAMDANAHLAAAAMFRRALQVITRDLLKAKRGTLASELKSVVGLEYNGIRIRNNFADVGYILKEAGNQGAHPDIDQDLLDFTSQDASDLQAIFMELVSEIFVVPAATRRARQEFLARRKIKG